MKLNYWAVLPAVAAGAVVFAAAVLAAEAHGRHRERAARKAVRAR